MASFQLLVRDLDGCTSCLQFSSNVISGHHLAERLASLVGVPAGLQRIVTGTREITPLSRLVADFQGLFPSCSLLLRLRGGKGGFGSLLRGAATKAGQKKTSNFDACRDMSGRRLRHVNAEKKLKEWKADAKERELERTAEAFLKKQNKKKEDESGIMKELDKFREETSKAMEDVESAVVRGLAEARRLGVDGKRKKVEAVVTESKRPRIWMIDEAEIEQDEDGDGGVLEDGNHHVEEQDRFETGESSKQPEDRLDSIQFSVPDLQRDTDSPKSDSSRSECHVESRLDEGNAKTSPGSSGSEQFDDLSSQIQRKNASFDANGSEIYNVALNEQLNFDDYQTGEQMEALGLERLKCELQARGLKCGGSLAERAARLFLLKFTPLENLDKKHFSKAKGTGK